MSDSQLSPDQEIRVIALEFASKTIDYQDPQVSQLVANAAKIESYIHKGADG
jgi:hypothetical protein